MLQYFGPALAITGLENQFSVFLRVAVLHRFYCISLMKNNCCVMEACHINRGSFSSAYVLLNL